MSKIITIMGNSNSGKTTFSCFLAQKLTAHGKKVIIISTNDKYPNTHFIIRKSDKSTSKSVGRVLSLAMIENEDIYHNIIFGDNVEIGYLCYASGESSFSYPEITQSNKDAFLSNIKSIADYIIVDTQAVQTKLDEFFIEKSDKIINIVTADVKGIVFHQYLQNKFSDAQIENMVHILYNNSSFNPYEDVKNKLFGAGKSMYELSNFKQLQALYNTKYIDDITCPRNYNKLLSKIIKEELSNEQTSD